MVRTDETCKMIKGGVKLAEMPCSYDETMKCYGFTGCLLNLNLQRTAKSLLNMDQFASLKLLKKKIIRKSLV